MQDISGKPSAYEGAKRGERKSLVETKGVSKYFRVKARRLWSFKTDTNSLVKAVDGVDLTIFEGQVYGLVGESGSGKSTLGRLLAGLWVPTDGEIFFRGELVSNERAKPSQVSKRLNRRVQMVFQNPFSSLNPRHTAGAIIGKALRYCGVPAAEIPERVSDILTRVGLEPRHAAMYPREFSGGQRQRISIARALAVEPEFIVCDEPVSALDVSVQAQILNLLRECQAAGRLTYLLISHDLEVVYYMSDRISVMYHGQIVESADSKELFDDPLHPYTETLLEAMPSPGRRRRASLATEAEGRDKPDFVAMAKGCLFFPMCTVRQRECASEIPTLIRVPTSEGSEGSRYVRCLRYG